MSLRSEPSKTSKLLTTVSLGEEVSWLGKTEKDLKTGQEYYQIKLSDGTTGWILTRGVVTAAKPAVLAEPAATYERPQLLKTTGATLAALTIVAVLKPPSDGWIEVVEGNVDNPTGAHLWLKDARISLDKNDVTLGVIAAKIRNEKEDSKRKTLIDATYRSSSFMGATLRFQFQKFVSNMFFRDKPKPDVSNLPNKVLTGDWMIAWSDEDAIAVHQVTKKEVTIYRDHEELVTSDAHCNCQDYTMASIVGSLVSYEKHYYTSNAEGGTYLETIDLNRENPQSALLTDIFDRTSVMEALQNNEVVRNRLGESGTEDLTMACISISQLSEFAFSRIERNEVEICISLLANCNNPRIKYSSQIKIKLDIPSNYLDLLQKADDNNTLMRSIYNFVPNWKIVCGEKG